MSVSHRLKCETTYLHCGVSKFPLLFHLFHEKQSKFATLNFEPNLLLSNTKNHAEFKLYVDQLLERKMKFLRKSATSQMEKRRLLFCPKICMDKIEGIMTLHPQLMFVLNAKQRDAFATARRLDTTIHPRRMSVLRSKN